ncbi:MAG: glycosyltransferase [Phenylobacterium sp.]|nr:MAG: glycosyltransferase [Phenylobacterium sp.]
MKVFLAGTSLRAAYGGPAVSVASLAGALAKAGAEVGLWAPDQSAPEAALTRDGAVRALAGGPEQALDDFGAPDVIHDNGVWLPHNHALARLAAARATPRIVSTRGMLEPWALRHKRWKKSLAWRAYQRRDLRAARLHHATSEAEAENLRRMGLGVAVDMIANGVDLPAPPAEAPRRGEAGVRTAMFLGRIYPVKGLPALIEAWARVRPAGWRLEIAGPDEAGHQAEVAHLAAKAGLGEVVSFVGPLEGRAKAAALNAADLLVLPSHSESFGMVVAEALAHGVPVLTTTAVPWPGLAQAGCGWRVEPTPDGLADGLRRALACDRATLRRMGARGRELVAADYGWDGVAARFLAAYARLAAGG